MSDAAALPPSDRRIWINGAFVPWEQATVHVLSHSHQRGSLIFDYMSVHDTPRGPAIFQLHEHILRLERSAELMGLPLALGVEEIERACVETVRANPGSHSLKVSAYLPSIEFDVVPMDPRVSVAIAAYDNAADLVRRSAGRPHVARTLKLKLDRTRMKMPADVMSPQAKVAANYTSPMTAKWKARREGYDEVVLVDKAGTLAEGPTTNIFLVTAAGTLRTPALDRILRGVTRGSVIEIAKHAGLEVEETAVRPEELFEAAEIFLTGTNAGVWPVESVDGRAVGAVCPGPVSRRLRDRLTAVTAGRDPAFVHWLTFVDEARSGGAARG